MAWALEESAKYYDKLWADGEEKNWQKNNPGVIRGIFTAYNEGRQPAA